MTKTAIRTNTRPSLPVSLLAKHSRAPRPRSMVLFAAALGLLGSGAAWADEPQSPSVYVEGGRVFGGGADTLNTVVAGCACRCSAASGTAV